MIYTAVNAISRLISFGAIAQSVKLSTTFSTTSYFNNYTVFGLNGSTIIIPFISSSKLEITTIINVNTFTGSAINFVSDSPQFSLTTASPYNATSQSPSTIPSTPPAFTPVVITSSVTSLALADSSYDIIAVPAITPPSLVLAYQVSTGFYTLSVNCTCFNIENSSLLFSLNTTAPFLSYKHTLDSYIQTGLVNSALAALGGANYSQTNFSLNVVNNGTTYSTPFSLVFFNCEDPYCLTCTFFTTLPVTYLTNGSPYCTKCVSGFSGTPCINCGDGMLEGSEQCDDGNTVSGDGCNSTCGIEYGYYCIGQPSAC